MANFVQTLFTAEERQSIEKEIGPLRSVSEFCVELTTATKDLPLKAVFEGLLPWAVQGGEIVAEVAPLGRAIVKAIDVITKERDPQTLGLFACTLAYQRSAALAIVQTGRPRSWVPFDERPAQLQKDIVALSYTGSLAGFSLEFPFAHPFSWQADESLRLVLESAGYDQTEWRSIQRRLHEQFRSDLAEVLSHGDTAPRFEPFRLWLTLGDNSNAYASINAHIERQRWLFEDRPVLGHEPFTLRDVYVDTDCGKLVWENFLGRGPDYRPGFDPFSEAFGGRHSLLSEVLGYLGNKKFNDAVVVQGAPGSGKSAFTLYLARVLVREGLRPLRIPLRLLNLRKNLLDALADVIRMPEEGEDAALRHVPSCKDPFLGGMIFQEQTNFREAEICPYVLLLDGWDEITVAVNEGFEIEVSRMLEKVRSEFLGPRTAPVRVILTGRPSAAVVRSGFLRDQTPILTVRPYTPAQLDTYVENVKHAVTHQVSSGENLNTWATLDWVKLDVVVERYRVNKEHLEVLGLPLLSHLSLRVLGHWSGDIEGLLADPTTLYRHLVDLTCAKAGKAHFARDEVVEQARFKGLELRRILHQTAAAITNYGQESIPFEELRLRLKLGKDEMVETATAAGRDQPLTKLMISFYFKGGQKQFGCEFLHKSFREYLFAEGIVEVIKKAGREVRSSAPKRPIYWADFNESPSTDERYRLSRELSALLAPRLMTREIQRHLERLIAWEIGRSSGSGAHQETLGLSFAPLTLEQWESVRDLLVDVWDWWAEGVHLRPQPYRDDSDITQYRPAYVNKLEDAALPKDRGPDVTSIAPGRLVNLDSNLGDALCRINSWLHYNILIAHKWYALNPFERQVESTEARPCQSRLRYGTTTYVLFRPSGSRGHYFKYYIARINASGQKPDVDFPVEADLAGADLSGTKLMRTNLVGIDLRGALLQEADLGEAFLERANLPQANMRAVQLPNADLPQANLSGANLVGAQLSGANLQHADLSNADLRSANLTRADLRKANLSRADLREANLREAILTGADLHGSNLTGADLGAAVLLGVDLSVATIS